MAWRELINQYVQQGTQRRMYNPGITNFGALVKRAMELKESKRKEAAEEGAKSRNIARSAVYGKYPQLAARELGLSEETIADVAGGTQPIVPEGFEPIGATVSPEGEVTTRFGPEGGTVPKPSWKQEQEIESIKAGLRRGKVTIGRDIGEPAVYPYGDEDMTMEHALNAISDAGYDPTLFKEELAIYDVRQEIPIKSGQYKGKIVQILGDGRAILKDTKELVTIQ